jgi:chemotaxis protein methyltransferase CheR
VAVFDDVHLETSEYGLLQELFNEHCGLVFGRESRMVVERRLRERLAALGLQSFREYYQLLRYDERGRAELDEAIDLVTINETYFFRETYQLRAYQTELLPMLRSGPQGRDRLSVWSAGCSTGEEVYSLAILTRETGLFTGRSVRIFGSDISRRCVAAARRGVYGPSAFRAAPIELRKRYFIERPDGMHVSDDLRAMCQFGHLNLLDASRAAVVGRVDVIFCRNVLIYFDEHSRRRVIEMFYDRLLPGGFLLLGHSESLINISTAFELVHLRGDLVYRKPLSSTRYAGSPGLLQAPSELGASPTWMNTGAAALAAPNEGSGAPRLPFGPAGGQAGWAAGSPTSAPLVQGGPPMAQPLPPAPPGRPGLLPSHMAISTTGVPGRPGTAPMSPGPSAGKSAPAGRQPSATPSLGRPGSLAGKSAKAHGVTRSTPATPMPAVPLTRPATSAPAPPDSDGGLLKPQSGGARAPHKSGKPGSGTSSGGGESGDKR